MTAKAEKNPDLSRFGKAGQKAFRASFESDEAYSIEMARRAKKGWRMRRKAAALAAAAK